jgi:8-oxo-dGTP pyrophosphatase MutT (NUDIX family)
MSPADDGSDGDGSGRTGPAVRAAGGVVWRLVAGGGAEGDAGPEPPPAADDVEVLVVHRPHRRDWSFPKGKADPGEDDESWAPTWAGSATSTPRVGPRPCTGGP